MTIEEEPPGTPDATPPLLSQSPLAVFPANLVTEPVVSGSSGEVECINVAISFTSTTTVTATLSEDVHPQITEQTVPPPTLPEALSFLRSVRSVGFIIST